MPRDGSGVYSKPAGTTAVPNTTVKSNAYNNTVDDFVADANNSRPVVAGGTGASNAAGARTNLGLGNVDNTSDATKFTDTPLTGTPTAPTAAAGTSTDQIATTAFVDSAIRPAFTDDADAHTAVDADNGTARRFTAATILALTAAATLGNGWNMIVVADGGDVTIDPNGSETVDGAASVLVASGQSCTLHCDGSRFFTVGLSGGGAVVQSVNTQTGAVATGTNTMSFDDTVPQITEGDEYMTRTITPTGSANTLKIEIVVFLSHNANAGNMQVALFQDAISDALAVGTVLFDNNASMLSIVLKHTMTAGTTSPITFRVRAGNSGGGTTTFNGVSGNRRHGGRMASSITVTELRP